MITVWKFPLPSIGTSIFEVPSGAVPRVLDWDPASGNPAVWYEVDGEAEPETTRVVQYGTGHQVESGGTYLGHLIQAGTFVWHFYEYRIALAFTEHQ